MRSGSARASIAAILPFDDREPHHRERAAVGDDDHTGGAVDEGGATHGIGRAKVIACRATRSRPASRDSAAGRSGAAVGADHHVGVEHGHQRVEVTVAGGGEEGVDRVALPAEVGVGRPAPPCTRRRARLASWRAAVGERPTIGAISSNGMANMSCSTKASRSAGRQRLEHHEQRQPDRVGEQRLVLGVAPSARGRRSGRARGSSSGSSRRVPP